MFADRSTWFDHELRVHRSSFACKICGEQIQKEEDLETHVLSAHANFPPEQLPTILELGRVVPSQLKAQDCPFCDDWAHSLYSKRHPQGETETSADFSKILVALSKFKKHVATHQEKLAIFTVPKSMDYDGSDASGRDGGSDMSMNMSDGSPDYFDTSDAFVMETSGTQTNKSGDEVESAVENNAEERIPRVLIVGCHPITLKILTKMLQREKIQDIHTAKDGEEAYETVKASFERNDIFDLIFMNNELPKLSGLTYIRLIRNLGYEGPIIALFFLSLDIDKAYEMGVSDVIKKPLEWLAIKRVLQRFGIASNNEGMSSLPTRQLYRSRNLVDLGDPTLQPEGNSLYKPDGWAATYSDPADVVLYFDQALQDSRSVNTANLIDVLPYLHQESVMELREKYKYLVRTGPEHKGVDVAKHIRARLRHSDIKLMTAAYTTALGMWESEGYWIWLALSPDNETRRGPEFLIEALLGRTNREVHQVMNGFRAHFLELERNRGTDMEDYLDDCLRQGEDWFRDVVVSVVSGSRMEDWDNHGQPRPIDMQLVEKDVDDLFESLAGERTDETTVPRIIVLRSNAHLKEVLKIYQRKYESDLVTDAMQGASKLRVCSHATDLPPPPTSLKCHSINQADQNLETGRCHFPLPIWRPEPARS